MDSVSERRKAVVYLVLAAVLWSTSGVLVKALDWHPLAILTGRSVFTSLVFLVYLRRIPTRFNRWKVLAALGSIVTQFLFVTSTKLTTAANAIFLQYTAPVYVVLLAYWFLREKPSRTDWLAMFIIFAGMVLFFGDKLSASGFYGNLLALLSGVTSALMIVSFRAQKDAEPGESVLLAGLVMGVLGFPSLLKESWTVTNSLIIAYLGLFQIGLAFVLFTLGIKHVPSLEANLIGTLEPVLNPLWVFLFLGERMGKYALFGGLIVLAGVALSAVGSARARKETGEKGAAR